MEKRILVLFIAAMLMLLPVKANSIGTGIGIGMETEQFKPLIWMCGERFLYDDNIEGGRNGCDQSCQVGCQQFNNCLDERTKNYAFTGEQIQWTVLVMDKNGIEKIKDVYVAVGEQGSPDFIEANCEKAGGERGIDPFCNARILEEELIEFKPDVMEYYTCTFTVEPGMHGEYWVHSAVVDLDDQTTTVDEDEYWFFNPEIGIKVTGELEFGTVRPGTVSYSPSILVGNEAEAGSGVMLDMFVSGTDFYDPAHSGAKCPTTNQLSLGSIRYYAVNGAYTTMDVAAVLDFYASIIPGFAITYGPQWPDMEGYLPINYGDHFDTGFYSFNEIMTRGQLGYTEANVLSPGAEMALTFKLTLPEPCNGDFSDGNIFLWGEAI